MGTLVNYLTSLSHCSSSVILDKTICFTEIYFTTWAKMILLKCESDHIMSPLKTLWGLAIFLKVSWWPHEVTWWHTRPDTIYPLFHYLLDLVLSLSLSYVCIYIIYTYSFLHLPIYKFMYKNIKNMHISVLYMNYKYI